MIQVKTLVGMMILETLWSVLSAAGYTGHRVMQSDTESNGGPKNDVPTDSEPWAGPRQVCAPGRLII
jgi:hypothetical protein